MGTGRQGALVTEFIASSRALEPGEFSRTPTRHVAQSGFEGTPLSPARMIDTIGRFNEWAAGKWGHPENAPKGLSYDIAKRIVHSTLFRELGIPESEWSHLIKVFKPRFYERRTGGRWDPLLGYIKKFGRQHALDTLKQLDEAAHAADKEYWRLYNKLDGDGKLVPEHSTDMFANVLGHVSWEHGMIKSMMNDAEFAKRMAKAEPPASRKRLMGFLRSHWKKQQ